MNFEKIASKLRYRVIQMSSNAKTAHLASALSCIDILTVLYEGIIKYDQFFAGWDDQNDPQRITNGWGDDNITSPNKSFAKTLYDNSVKNYKTQDSVMSIIYINHAVSMLDALIANTLSSNQLSLSYDYNSIINFHQAQLSVKLN